MVVKKSDQCKISNVYIQKRNARPRFVIYLFVSLLTMVVYLEGCTSKDRWLNRNNANRRIAMDTRILDRIRSGVCAIGYLKENFDEKNKNKLEEYVNKNPDCFEIIGTGFMVRDTTAITNRHVLEELKNRQKEFGFLDNQIFLNFVYPVEKGKWQEAFCQFKFAGFIANKELDIGFIEFMRRPEPGFEQCLPLELGDSSLVTTGQPIGVFGYPYGTNLLDVKIENKERERIQRMFRRFGPVLHQGYISAIAPFDDIGVVDKLILDISFAGGMSGSPVFNLEDGSIIGLFYAGMGKVGIVAFAIPIDSERVNKWLELHDRLRNSSNNKSQPKP